MSWNDGLKATNLPSLFAEKTGQGDAIFATCDDGRVFAYAQFWSLAGSNSAVPSRVIALPFRSINQLKHLHCFGPVRGEVLFFCP
jgi:hypothetical protein